jgi:hypothetical protein
MRGGKNASRHIQLCGLVLTVGVRMVMLEEAVACSGICLIVVIGEGIIVHLKRRSG